MQEDFEEFSDVDELYSSLPLDKVEALEELVTIGPPGLVKVNLSGISCVFMLMFPVVEACDIHGLMHSYIISP